ncbi:Alstrom syndrome protein 1 [Crotalus tigris]|uniref:Alstrom syndrome protein 1 n=1 Tax=Crotalus tigris TaxID=88082 RepID=UPI00192F5180|nr:Alstrom syndrome protein 1 [Crotalus tigris]
MEAPPQGSSQVPPIVTTPPHPGSKAEPLSQSSSGTHVSNASGVSLGEAIRRRSLVDQDAELWFRPCAETDVSNLVGWRLGHTPGGYNTTDFPTMEEGLVTPTVNPGRPQASGMTHSPILGIADSQLSPNLPLLATNTTAQGQTFYNETVFQPTGLDFAPLRATPDVSAAPLAHLQIGEAVRWAAREVGPESSRDASLSQHPLPFSLTAPNDASLGSYLSQHPLTFSEHLPAEQPNWPMLHLDLNFTTLGSKEENSGTPCPAAWPNRPLATPPLPKQSWGAAPGQDLFLLDNSLPAPVLLDLLEDEMGLSKHGGFLSSRSSSCQSGLGKEPAENLVNRLTTNADLTESMPKLTPELRPSEGPTASRPESPQLLSEATGQPRRRASDPEAFSVNLSPPLVSSRAPTFGLVESPETSPGPNCQRVREKCPSGAAEEKRKFVPVPVDGKPQTSVPFQPIPVASRLGQPTDALKTVLTSVNKTELTLSDGSVEKETRNTGISPFDEASFLVHLTQPIHHSTPAFLTSRSLNREGPDLALPARSGLQPPLACLHEEMSNTSQADARNSSAAEPGAATAGNPRLFPTNESFPSHDAGPAVLQPLKGRIQSMPSLNFMEKVGAWNLSCSAEELPEVSAVPGPGGVSPRRKAYDAIADSLNCLLLKQQRLADLKAASFYGPSSLINLHTSENEPLRALPFTRSQSETSVSALSREISRTEIGNETGAKDPPKRAEVRGDAPTVSRIPSAAVSKEDSLSRRYKAVPVFTVSSDEESMSPGSRSDPLIRSRRVAELLKGETASLNGSKEEVDGPEEKTGASSGRGFRAGQIRRDHWRDLSPDHFNQGTDSGTDSCTDLRLSSRQSSRSSPLLGKLQSSLEEELQAPLHSELNIEERIPVYLHNLGIDQSPSSILTPFMPRGPIREIEFSPTELRTLKASADLFRLHLSEDSQSGKEATRCSLNSSLLSGPSGAGSAVVSDTSQPAKSSLQRNRDLVHPSSSPWKSRAVTPPLAASLPGSPSVPVSTGETQVLPGAPSNFAKERSTTIVDNLDPNELGASRVRASPSSWDRDEKPAREEIGSSSASPGGGRNDSFAGSKAPGESQKLPAEVDSRPSSGQFRSLLSLSSSGSLKHIDNGDLSGGCGSIKRNTLGIQRGWSWDENMAKQGIAGNLRWEGPQTMDFYNKEPLVPQEPRPESPKANEDRGMTKPLTRSDPEGCPRTAASGPVLTSRSVDIQAGLSPNLNAIQAVSEADTLDQVSKLLGGFPCVEEKADTLDEVSKLLGGFPHVEKKANDARPKEVGSWHESANGSSVDSLGTRVKKLLQYEPLAIHKAPWMERAEEREGSGPKEPCVSATSSAFSRGEVGAQGSDNGSSMDSLAVRVKTLLEEEQPVLHATQILQSVKEEEEKARAWVKLKLATQPQYFIPELTEEDRRMIEQMKRQQLSCSGEKEHLEKQHWRSNFQSFPNRSPAAAVEPGHWRNLRDHDLQMALQKYGLQLVEFSEPVTDGALAADPEVKPSRAAQIPASSQVRTPPGNALDSDADSHVPSEAHLKEASKTPVKKDRNRPAPLDISESVTSVEAAIQTTSITFASRRRSPSPASRVPQAVLAEADAHHPISSEAHPTSQEQPKFGNSQLPSDDARRSARLGAACLSEKKDGSPSSKVCSPSGSVKATRDGPHQEGLTAPVETFPSRGIQPKDLIKEKRSSDPVLAEQRRRAKTLDNISPDKTGPERSVMLPPQKTGHVRSQNCSVDKAGSAAKPLLAEGKENTSVREGTSASDSYLHKPEDIATPDSYLHKARSRDSGSTGLLHAASLDRISTAVLGSPTSPTRKALSGVHLTLSPQRVELDLSGPVDTGPEGREVEVVQPTPLDVPRLSLEDTSGSKPAESRRKTQESSEASSPDVPTGAKPVLQQAEEPLADRDGVAGPSQADAGTRSSSGPSAGENLKTTASSQTEWTSSDAITQITTESPEKTTYSAEIFVAAENGEASFPKSHETPIDTRLGASEISVLNGQTADQPLVLPYKPPGCSEVYYVPCGRETLKLSRVRSETTVESSHSGSNDAFPPDFPPQVLGSRKDHPSDTAMVKHKEGIYSRKATPRAAWTEEKAARTSDPGESCNGRNSLESLKTSRSESARLKPPLQDDPDSPPGSKALGQVEAASRGPALSPQDLPQRKGILESSPSPSPPLHLAQKEESFVPLTGEVDYSFLQELTFEHASKRDLPDAPKTIFGRAGQLLPGKPLIKEKRAADQPRVPRAHLISSLDVLWAKYLGRQNQQQLKPVDSGHRTELSLVERLDRLARLLQNPLRHSLALALEDQKDSRKEPRRRAPSLDGARDPKMAARKKAASRPGLETAEEAPVGPSGAWPSKSRRPKTGHAKAVEPGDRNWDRSQSPETASETSSDVRPAREASVTTEATSESEGNRAETESATQTETSESVSTINTARLIRAFGQERVQVSPKLSQLYSTIDLQKTRSETWAKRGKKAKGDGYPKMVHLEQKRKEGQASPTFVSSDSVSSLSSSPGPSPALSSKRMLNKAVQAGDFEIVNSATKSNTRDVGLTFPTPTPSQATLHGGARSRTEQRSAQHDGLSAGDEDQPKWQPSSILEGKRPRRSRSQWMQGVSWFVPAADFKPDPLERAGTGFPPPGPTPAWFEPLPRGKPWREPLREQNWPERLGVLQVRLAAPARDAENEPPSPLGQMTLQESLAVHRPDFISSSGERLKRLRLLVEERKLQSVFQGEREELFNPPEVVTCRNASLANRGYRAIRSRAISKNEMVERSKRIYEQLPEVRKRREEEKRKSEYSTNRLKAQLYKTKITNRVLGRKVPWE